MDKALVISSVLVAVALTGIVLTSGYAQGDDSETNTEQSIAQKNVGSGESTNNNCGVNSIDATLAASDFTRGCTWNSCVSRYVRITARRIK